MTRLLSVLALVAAPATLSPGYPPVGGPGVEPPVVFDSPSIPTPPETRPTLQLPFIADPFSMPVIEPRDDVEFHTVVKEPNPTIEYYISAR